MTFAVKRFRFDIEFDHLRSVRYVAYLTDVGGRKYHSDVRCGRAQSPCFIFAICHIFRVIDFNLLGIGLGILRPSQIGN